MQELVTESVETGTVRAFDEMPLPRSLEIPRPVATLLGGAFAAGVVRAAAGHGDATTRMLRGVRLGSTLAYFVTAAVDAAEHFRLEKQVTGHWFRWTVVPPTESAIHALLLATNISALLFVRRPRRRRRRARDWWSVCAPALFLAVGWLDELAFHRRRARHREDIIHTTEHLCEGVMWATLYAR